MGKKDVDHTVVSPRHPEILYLSILRHPGTKELPNNRRFKRKSSYVLCIDIVFF